MCDKFNQDVQCNQIQVKCEMEVASSDQNKESQSNIVCNNVEVSLNQRRKRLHMGIVTCDEVGNASLAEPQDLTRNTERTDVNRGLYPVVRNKRRKIDTGNDDVQLNHNAACPGFMPASQAHGFVSASNMYRIDNYSRQNNASPANTSHSNSSSPRKPQKKIKQILNQGSIMNFISLKPSTPDKTHRSNGIKEEKVELDTKNEKVSATTAEQKDDDDDDDISALYTGRSVMFSPIKKQGSDDDSTACIYISDSSPSSSPASSQGSRTNSQRSTVANNVVVKRLFEAQKTVDKNVPQKGPMKRKSISQKPSTLPFISKNELSNLKTEAAKYFENDSFDMNAVFNSDMEDFADSPKPPIPVSKAIKSDKYGLLGTGSYPRENSEKVNYFERLPPEVLENIFCQLPMLDLSLNSNRVCSQWNSIIGNEKFVPWKKLYSQLKRNHGDSRQRLQEIMSKHHMTFPSKYLAALVRYMRDFKPVTAGNMRECLSRHSKYKLASQLLEERLPDCVIHKIPNPWSVIALLVILAPDVYEIQEIMSCLSIPTSQCTAMEIIECLYCIACFLFAFKLAKRADVWNGMHYRLFYALYLFENASSSSAGDLKTIMADSKAGQQSLYKYSAAQDSVRLTHEQLRIVKHQAGPHEVIKIVAFAGTGKTTTLVRYTQFRPDKKFLLVVYNKSVRDYAKTKFPHNVECRTGHSLAFGVFGRRFAHKLGNLKVYTLTQALQARKGINLYLQAKFVMTTLENYFASADEAISMEHVPSEQMDEKTGLKTAINLGEKRALAMDAQSIWHKMQEYNEKKVVMTHDGYLKLYQLSRPRLDRYNCILIDEAQDLTPAITDILLRQPQGKILVGDPHQQIYSFRGAVNAMELIPADTVFYLTQSFRFGPEIAHVAMSCLEVLKGETKKTLVGSGKKCQINGDRVGQLAIICRCNFTVFSEAVKKCCYSNEECRVAFIGGTDNFGFPMLMDMYSLTLPPNERDKEGHVIKNKFVAMFKTLGDLEKFATKSLDVELQGKIKIVKTYHHNLPVFINKIQSKCVRDERQADYVFSTAHKAKGLEFSTVRVTDDFAGDISRAIIVMPNPVAGLADLARGWGGEENDREEDLNYIAVRPSSECKEDEHNLLYVAVTRAKNALQMSPTLLTILKRAGIRFTYPVSSAKLAERVVPFRCLETNAEFKPHCVTLEKQKITLADGTVREGGVYSPALLTEDSHSMAELLGLSPQEIKEKQKLEEKL
ncbi:F-box DNA helicase 1-like [Mya arenaria]|uniref:F-box DNA helicase 1-like n=1 Tax=Mya arenaria TaxID=6604 RepID=UPI0022DF0DCF|nr:F-box DNA helicase 1-like [Mya arenaria]